MRILVCGSRYWDDHRIMWSVLDGYSKYAHDEPKYRPKDSGSTGWINGKSLTIIEGGQKKWVPELRDYVGADHVAAEWAYRYALHHEKYEADWETHGKAAGPIRNQRMLDEGKPELVLAFTNDLESSRGTKDMVTRALATGVQTYVIGDPKLDYPKPMPKEYKGL